MRKYKDTYVGKSSTLAEALTISDNASKKAYNETSANFLKLYGEEAAKWFYAKHRFYSSSGPSMKED